MLTWHAPAKINLFLHVVGKFDDGYHELQTAYQMLDWCDELEFESTQDGSIRRGNKVAGVAESDDITIRAAKLLRNCFPGPQGAVVRCQKRLPIGAGLGGGSSDAAATLLALNQLWELNADVQQLAEIGLQVGADVPVFVYGKNAWAEGRGEVLSPLSLPKRLYLVVYPNCQVSTERVFQEFKASPFQQRLSVEVFQKGRLGNDLEAATCRLYPEVKKLIKLLQRWGEPKMTGSGSAVFLPIQRREAGESMLASLPNDWTGRVCVGQAS